MTSSSPSSEVAGGSAGPLRRGGDQAPQPWRAAELRLYPLITADPALYEVAVTLVREAADVLRAQCGTVTELEHIRPSDVLGRCRSAPVVADLGLDPGTALDAARALRWRELVLVPVDEPHPVTSEGPR